VARRREDGLPYDSWVRTHVRAGTQIVKVAPRSMVIAGTIAEWSRWTGLGFTASGPAIVPGALSPIHVSLEQDHAVYVEPNLWVRHRLICARLLRLAAASIRRVLTGWNGRELRFSVPRPLRDNLEGSVRSRGTARAV
jgi:hypothetical protein